MTPTDHISTSGPYGHPWRISGAGSRILGFNAELRGAHGREKHLLGAGSVSTVSQSCTELCVASGRERPPQVSLLPPSPSLLLTAVARRPADRFHGVLLIHDLGEPKVTLEGHRGELPSGRGSVTPPRP